MNRNEFGRDLFDNIEIQNDMKRELFENCKRGKRTADFRFRYSGVLTALIVSLVFGGTGLGAMAYYGSVASRMENMSEKEREDYSYEVANDTGVTVMEGWSRDLTDDEVLRAAKIEQEYYKNNVFPDTEVPRVATLSEWDGKSICYVDEDHKLHFPEEEMTDEQLRLFVDYTAKRDYVIEQEAKAAEEEASEDEDIEDVGSPYVDIENITEEELVDIAYKHLANLFGEGIGDVVSEGWHTRVEAFKPSAADCPDDLSHDMYFVYWEQDGGSSLSTDYVVVLGMYELEMRAVAARGREYRAGLGSYTLEEAKIKSKDDKPKIYAELARLYGLPDAPDKIKTDLSYEYDDYGEVRITRYVLKYGDKLVDINWNLSEEKISSVEFD